jgi:hypothetical protein
MFGIGVIELLVGVALIVLVAYLIRRAGSR